MKDSFKFTANRLVITNVDIQSVEPVDQRTRDSLQKSVQLAIEITTNSQEASARSASCTLSLHLHILFIYAHDSMTYEIISVSNRFSLSYPVYFNIDPELFMLDISHITHILHGNFAPQTKTKTKIKIRWDTI